MLRRALIALVCTAIACASRSELDVPVDSTPPICKTESGVRLCGLGCPNLEPPDCSGRGCEAVSPYDGVTSDAGVCWSDSVETEYRCDGCSEGDACLSRDDVLLCVPTDVCKALWERGVRDVCRYTDKRKYDNQPLPHGVGCPSTVSGWHACGGDCPSCDPADRCVGVSPDHPFGLCNGDMTDGYMAKEFSCPVRAVFDVPSEDLQVALQYAVCMADAQSCVARAKDFPGGLGCYDFEGNRLN